MKKILRYTLLSLIAISVLAVNGCKKNDDENGPDKGSLITSHTWNFSSLTTSSTDPMVQAVVNLAAAFFTNGTLTFSSGGTYTMSILGSSGGGTWELSADGSTLTFDKGTEDELIYSVITLTSDVLSYSFTDVDEDLGTYDMIFKWVK